MRMRSLLLVPVALAACGGFLATQSAAADGDRPAYTFQRPILNGMGLTSLAELQGKPVLVEFWGTR